MTIGQIARVIRLLVPAPDGGLGFATPRDRVAAVSIMADWAPEQVGMLGPDDLAVALAACIDLNADVFYSERGDTPDHPDATPAGWFDAVQSLIGAGHRWCDIQGYTLAQFKGFLKAVNDAQADRFKAGVIGVRLGVWAKDLQDL